LSLFLESAKPDGTILINRWRPSEPQNT